MLMNTDRMMEMERTKMKTEVVIKTEMEIEKTEMKKRELDIVKWRKETNNM